MDKLRNLRLSKKLLLASGGIAVVVAGIFLTSSLVIGRNNQFVLQSTDDKQAHHSKVGIVLGAGITKDGKPFRELQSRLDTAAKALQAGYVDELLLSGDNRFDHYNEPKAMKDYLVSKHGIDASMLQPDYAGRSTYESCERAAKVFQVDQAILFSAGSHLPRAIYLCRHFGLEAYGIASPAEANNANRREAVARVKALFNVHVKGENTLLGSPIKL